MQTEQPEARNDGLPFASFSEFLEGYKSGKFQIGMFHRLNVLVRVLPVSSSLFYFPLILSPFILGFALATHGLLNARLWLLLALPVAWLDYRASTGALNLFRLLLWLPVAFIGFLVHTVFDSLGSALSTIGFSFIGTSLLCSAGIGTAKMELESLVIESEALFWSSYDSGLIFLFDTTSGKIYQRPQ